MLLRFFFPLLRLLFRYYRLGILDFNVEVVGDLSPLLEHLLPMLFKLLVGQLYRVTHLLFFISLTVFLLRQVVYRLISNYLLSNNNWRHRHCWLAVQGRCS